jgi:hypothetical protein
MGLGELEGMMMMLFGYEPKPSMAVGYQLGDEWTNVQTGKSWPVFAICGESIIKFQDSIEKGSDAFKGYNRGDTWRNNATGTIKTVDRTTGNLFVIFQ